MEFDTFKHEQDVIDCSEAFLAKNEAEDCLVAYEKLLKEYKKLLKVSRRLAA